MDRALALATDPRAPRGENPRVGCVILDSNDQFAGEGFHKGAGSAHAEVVALAAAGERARGGTAIVTLEPCRHTGRTGPCTTALLEAGIARVVFAQSDPTAEAGGGGRLLSDSGVDVIAGVRADEAVDVNREWSIAVVRGYPYVTAKIAVSLDGRVAGENGRRVQLTGPQARVFAHALRAQVQAIITGTGTVLSDDPELTVRDVPVPVTGQPLRVIMGCSDVPVNSRLLSDAAPAQHMRVRDPQAVLAHLYDLGVRHVLLEAGPSLLRAFWEAGYLDDIEWLLAGVWLGAGPKAFPDGEDLMSRVAITSTEALGQDVRVSVRVSEALGNTASGLDSNVCKGD